MADVSNGIPGMNVIRTGTTASVKDALASEQFVYFTVAEGIRVRLSYHGTHGWRLQTNRKDYDSFSDAGASQALAAYMGEEIPSLLAQVGIWAESDALRVTAPDGTYVRISLGADFFMDFFSADGKKTYSISQIALVKDGLCLSGALEKGEAIYGGGERFDTVNKRGTSFSLYISDGWNRVDTTYMAIPLFVFSRGSGMFINRYEKMVADFGEADPDTWSVALKTELLDCYIYPSGDVKAPYLGYAQLSGHAAVPEEWAQGVLICRYAPDLKGLEDHPEFTTPLTYDDVIAAPVPKQAEESCKCLWIKRIRRSTGEVSYVKVDHYEDDEEYTYDASLVYFTRGGGKYYRVAYYLRDGAYYRSGSKGSPGGMGVKTLTNAFLAAGMKPTALILEPLDWGNISRDIDFCKQKAREVGEIIAWLHERDIKAMVYMGLGGGISPCSRGFDEKYRVWANIYHPDGTVEKTTALPQVQGGVNPDLGNSSRRGYIDITNPEAMEWYFGVIWEQILRLGIDGIKIDFCEFVPDETPYETGTRVEYLWHDPSFFGKNDVHHAYPSYFLSMYHKRILEMKKEMKLPNGFTLLSRGGGIGCQRAPYMWAGDQTRTFEKIEDQYIATLTSGLSGVPFMTYDMGGYQYQEHEGYYTMGDEEGRLFSRAVECTAFTTVIQTHGDVRQAFEMNGETQEIYRRYTALHSLLIPHIQKYSRVASETGLPVVRHLILHDHTDPCVYDIETEFLLGEGLLVAPIFADGVYEKEVYLPRGRWKNLLTDEICEGGQSVSVKASIGQIPVFLDLDSADAAALSPIFEGEIWQRIKNS